MDNTNLNRARMLSEYDNILESCREISKALNGNRAEVLKKIEECKNQVCKLVEIESFCRTDISDTSMLSCLQQQLNALKKKLSIKQKTSPKPVTTSENFNKSPSITDILRDCEIDVADRGFETIVGLQAAKDALVSSVVLLFRQPQLYDGLKLRNCILLFGPPGTGKTKLAIATAAEAKAKFISVSSGNLLSPYVGLSEKVKNEILCQISSFGEVSNGYLICATNCPWELDGAFLRRFQRQLYIPLPNDEERYNLLKFYCKGTLLEQALECQLGHIVGETNGYSGSDIEQLVMQTLLKPIERLRHEFIWKQSGDGTCKPYVLNEPLCPENEQLLVCDINKLPAKSVRRPEPNVMDLLEALKDSRRTVSANDIEKFQVFIR